MQKSYKEILKYVWIVYALFSIGIVLYFTNNLICEDIEEVSDKLILNSGWDITIGKKEYSDVELDSFVFDTVEKGECITLKTTLPEDWGYSQAALCVHNRHTTLSMYIDDSLEYEYGHERYKNNKATGSGYLFINCLDEYKGKTLTLEFFVTENSAFSKFDDIWISEWNNTYRQIITENRVPMLVGSFLIILGLMMAFILVFAVTVSKKYRKVLCLAIFSICVGIWTLCYYNVVMVFSIPLHAISLMEHMALYVAPIPIMMYMYEYIRDINSKIIKRIYIILFTSQVILSAVTIVLHIFDIVHGAHLLPSFQMLFLAHIIFFMFVLFRRMKWESSANKFKIFGLLLVVICVTYEIWYYCIDRHIGYRILEIKGISSIGFMIFIGILVIDLYMRVVKAMMEEHEKEVLIKRAYTDDLTQLYNRGYCSDYMDRLRHEKARYGIINFDLNNLKTTNDTHGHIKGDELICHAASVIQNAFCNNGVVGRMGGDEFIAIVDTSDSAKIEEMISKFIDSIKDVNDENPGLDLSISYGYATSDELNDESPEKVYQMADKRMYEFKRKTKELV